MPAPLRLIVCGAAGRMGSLVMKLAREDGRFAPGAGIVRGNAVELPARIKDADALIDFSKPDASMGFAEAAAFAGKAIAIGTTGFSRAQEKNLKSLSGRCPILLSANFSLGVNVMIHLAETAARLLKGYEASISEVHHKHKKDSPSGTALALGEAVRRARPEEPTVAIASERTGDIVGNHTLSFTGMDDGLELTHQALSRAIFAKGALEAALWLNGKKPGLYGMRDMLEIP